jgi:hypothetical protein
MDITPTYYLILATTLFVIGAVGRWYAATPS